MFMKKSIILHFPKFRIAKTIGEKMNGYVITDFVSVDGELSVVVHYENSIREIIAGIPYQLTIQES